MSKTKKIIMWTLLGLLLAIGIGSVYFLGHDNVVEESVEYLIEKQIGQDIDLSPFSKED